LVPAEKLGIVVLTNSESDLMAALTYRLLDDLLAAPRPRTDWVAAFAEAARLGRVQADSTVRAAQATRDSVSRPSLPLERYTAHHRAEPHGDGGPRRQRGTPALRVSRSPAVTGDLEPWQYDPCIAPSRTRHLDDAHA